MTRIKAALAILLGLLVVGLALAPVASATELCTEVSETCEEESIIAKGASIAAKLNTGTESSFSTSEGTVNCEASTLEGESTAEDDVPLPITISTLKFSGCLLGEEIICTVTAANLPYSAELYAEASGDGLLYLDGGGSGNPGEKVTCGKTIECTFSTTEASLAFDGSAASLITASKVALKTEGAKCPKEVKWSATYKLTSPNKGQVGAAGGTTGLDTKLCKAQESRCTQVYLASQAITGANGAGTNITVELFGPNRTITCPTGKIKGVTEQEAGTPALKTKLQLLEFINCTSGGNSCLVELLEPPYVGTKITSISPSLGEGKWDIHLRIEVKCAGLSIIGCKYEKESSFAFRGSAKKIEAFSMLQWKEIGTGCSDWVRINGVYPLSEPTNAVFVTN